MSPSEVTLVWGDREIKAYCTDVTISYDTAGRMDDLSSLTSYQYIDQGAIEITGRITTIRDLSEVVDALKISDGSITSNKIKKDKEVSNMANPYADECEKACYYDLPSKVKQLGKDDDTKLLESYGVTNKEGILTGNGLELVANVLFEDVELRSKVVEKLKALKEQEKESRK